MKRLGAFGRFPLATDTLIVAAIQDAQARASAAAQSEMGRLTEGLDLPPGMKLPF
jgi:DNA-binding protein YbaB